MDHFYQHIHGWFDFEDIYFRMVREAINEPLRFAEIGAFKGKSTSYMAVEIINSGKNIKFDVIDIFTGSNEEAHKNDPDFLKNGNYFEVYQKNIKPVESAINTYVNNSVNVARKMAKDGIKYDFVFIDASHEYQDVKDDLENWFPLIKKGGYIGGHDYKWFIGVKKAVDEFFKDKGKVELIKSSFLYKK